MNVASWVVSPGGLSLGILTRFEQSSTSSDLLFDNVSNNRAFWEVDICIKDVTAELGNKNWVSCRLYGLEFPNDNPDELCIFFLNVELDNVAYLFKD